MSKYNLCLHVLSLDTKETKRIVYVPEEELEEREALGTRDVIYAPELPGIAEGEETITGDKLEIELFEHAVTLGFLLMTNEDARKAKILERLRVIGSKPGRKRVTVLVRSKENPIEYSLDEEIFVDEDLTDYKVLRTESHKKF